MTVEDLIREWERLGREIVELSALREHRRQEQEAVRAQARDAMRASDRAAGWIVDDRIYFITSEGFLDVRPIANLPGGSR